MLFGTIKGCTRKYTGDLKERLTLYALILELINQIYCKPDHDDRSQQII